MALQKISEKAQAIFEPFLMSYLEPTFTILQKDKFLTPMGMILEKPGKPRFVSLVAENEKDFDMAAHLEAYRKLLKQELGDNKAFLLGYDVKLHDPEHKDAVCVEVHDKSGLQLKVLVPYKFSGFRKKLSVGEMRRVA